MQWNDETSANPGKMHADEVSTDAVLVRRLLVAQFPRWSQLDIRPVASAGTDNALYRLGDDMVVRLPRIHWAVEQVEKEQTWLPRLAPDLPLTIPEPLAIGDPGEGYPWRWSIYRWLEGENASLGRLADVQEAAVDLARFVAALQRIDATEGPRPGEHNSWRGVALALRDSQSREALAALRGVVDVEAAVAVWETALSASPWRSAPVWVHGDLQVGNLLVRNGKLSAVIDFGCLGVGDPACDIMTAWLYLPAAVRPAFRAELGVDDDTWTRARGWALSVGLIALPYYVRTNPALADLARRAIRACIDDFHV